VIRGSLPPAAGALTALASGPGGLRVDGWLGALSEGELEGFDVSLGRRHLNVHEWHARPPSRAVGPDRSNFRIVVRDWPRSERSTLVTVIPHVPGRDKRPLFGALERCLPLPPKSDREAVAMDFLPKAFRSLDLLVGLARLRRDGRVLDVGCGVGRITYALAHYLSARGRYEGFDAAPRWIDWNQKTISARFPNFRFRFVDVRNGVYNRRSHENAAQLQFPYADGTFDTALVESVFQHNRVPVVRHYLDEIGRVLRVGGRCVVTSFLLRRGMRAADQRADRQNFIHSIGGAWSASSKIPEIGIAFDAARFEDWVSEAGLELAEFHRGDWHCEGPGLAYQDVIVLEKPRRTRRLRGSVRRRR
jgi:SAM-dependent methyltransferase